MQAQTASEENEFRIMSYNIRYAGNEQTEGVNSWKQRKQLVASMIDFNHADIVGLQEALLIQLDDLTNLLKGFSWVGAGRDDGDKKGEFSAIFFKTDRFEVVEQGTFWLSETPGVPSIGWDAAFPRVATWANFLDKRTQKSFLVFNTHFDHVGEMARINSSKLLLQRIRATEKTIPVILTGDFNTKDTTKAYQELLRLSNSEVNLFDAQFISKKEHHGSHVTFNGFGKSIEPGNKIDHIFITESVEVLKHGVIDETVDGNYPSDHMPVVAEVNLK